ncbi:MAG: hypothetical protein E6G94_06185 [Alphaproteobacteria bacterium]|nr:MAG: hypothetical protein E6G94_06185 [Alphaproteobacteria bacterium]
MKVAAPTLIAALLLTPTPLASQRVEKVKAGSSEAQKLPEDLFGLPPGAWAFAEHLWQGEAPCTADACEAGYTSGELAISVERAKTWVRILAGFRGCASVAWSDFEIGKKASGGDSKEVRRRIKKAVGTSAKYCKAEAPAVAELDAKRLYPAPPPKTP